MSTVAEHEAQQVAEQAVAQFYVTHRGEQFFSSAQYSPPARTLDIRDLQEVATRAAALAVEAQTEKILAYLEGWPQEFQRKATGIRTLIEGDLP